MKDAMWDFALQHQSVQVIGLSKVCMTVHRQTQSGVNLLGYFLRLLVRVCLRSFGLCFQLASAAAAPLYCAALP